MAVRGPDPHNLRKLARDAQQKSAPIISEDHPCDGCGYNLRGLRLGANCPECGMPSVASAFANEDGPLASMPMHVILAIVRGCWVASICVVLMIGVMLIERFGVLDTKIALWILTALAMFWWGATILLTPAFTLTQAVARGFSQRSKLRTAARWLQCGWPLLAAAAATNSMLPANAFSPLLGIAQFIGLLAGLAGIVLLSLLLERLAEWARDEDAQTMFNGAMWTWPLGMLLYMPAQLWISSWLGAAGRYHFGLTLFLLLWVIAIGTFPCGLLMLARSVTFSVFHRIEYIQREQRRQQRDEEHQARLGERAARTESHPRRSTQKRPT